MSKSYKSNEDPIPTRSYNRHKARSKAEDLTRLRYNTEDEEYLDMLDDDDWAEEGFEKFSKKR